MTTSTKSEPTKDQTYKRLRCAWEVRAGIIPGTPLPERTKQFFYTEEDWEKDTATIPVPGTLSIFQQRLKEAYDYCAQVSNPSYHNWTEITWIWY